MESSKTDSSSTSVHPKSPRQTSVKKSTGISVALGTSSKSGTSTSTLSIKPENLTPVSKLVPRKPSNIISIFEVNPDNFKLVSSKVGDIPVDPNTRGGKSPGKYTKGYFRYSHNGSMIKPVFSFPGCQSGSITVNENGNGVSHSIAIRLRMASPEYDSIIRAFTNILDGLCKAVWNKHQESPGVFVGSNKSYEVFRSSFKNFWRHPSDPVTRLEMEDKDPCVYLKIPYYNKTCSTTFYKVSKDADDVKLDPSLLLPRGLTINHDPLIEIMSIYKGSNSPTYQISMPSTVIHSISTEDTSTQYSKERALDQGSKKGDSELEELKNQVELLKEKLKNQASMLPDPAPRDGGEDPLSSGKYSPSDGSYDSSYSDSGDDGKKFFDPSTSSGSYPGSSSSSHYPPQNNRGPPMHSNPRSMPMSSGPMSGMSHSRVPNPGRPQQYPSGPPSAPPSYSEGK